MRKGRGWGNSMAISVSKSQGSCPGERQPRWAKGVARGLGWLSTADRRRQPPSPPLMSKGPLQCLDLTSWGQHPRRGPQLRWGRDATQPVLPCLSLQGFPSPRVCSSAPSSGAPPTSLCFLCLCLLCSGPVHSSLPCSACLFLPFFCRRLRFSCFHVCFLSPVPPETETARV